MGTPASSPERYANFLEFARNGRIIYITPPLEGIDCDEQGNFHNNSKEHLKQYYVLDPALQWVIVPINSANYCVSIEQLERVSDRDWEIAKEALNNASLGHVEDAIQFLRRHDVARVSTQQFIALSAVLRDIEENVVAAGGDPRRLVRMAVIHHQLLPVSLNEEFKTFESIINLGQLRWFLSTNGFDVVLHGHKHASKIIWDHMDTGTSGGAGSHQKARRVLIVSAPSLADVGPASSVGRILDLDAEAACPQIRIQNVGLALPGTQVLIDEPYTPLALRDWKIDLNVNADQFSFVSGSTVSEAYDRVIALFENHSKTKTLFNIVCHISTSPDPFELPEHYPEDAGGGHNARRQWFKDLVSWWQKAESVADESLNFTHGKRIRNLSGGNQMERLIELLSGNDRSSRGVIGLFSPELDKIHSTSNKFPSFCLVQFAVRRGDDDNLYLDCLGYFRKQEMSYWWPVNVAEIRMLQEEVHRRLLAADKKNLRLGTITTVAAIATVGGSPPQVLVPQIDRALDEDRNRLWSMVYALFRADLEEPEKEQAKQEWKDFFEDLIPSPFVNPDGAPVSVAGVSFILQQLELFMAVHPSEQHQELAGHLDNLLRENKAQLNRIKTNSVNQEEHSAWHKAVTAAVTGINKHTGAILAS